MKVVMIILIVIFTVSGCTDRSDIESDVFAAGIAIDLGEHKRFKVSAEVITSGNGGDTATVASKVIGAEGDTVLEAISAMVAESSKRLNFDHCNVLVLSPQVAETSLEDVLDLAFRDTGLRLSMLTVISKNCAAFEILNSNSVVNVIRSYEVTETVKVNAEEGDTTVYKLINSLNAPQRSGAVPTFTLKDTVSEENVNLLDGIALFRNGAFVGFTEPSQSRLMLLAAGDLTKGTLTCRTSRGNAPMTLFVRDVKRTLKTITERECAAVDLHLEIKAELPEIPSSVSLRTAAERSALERDISRYLSQNIYVAVTDAMTRYGTDVFGFSTRLLTRNREFCRRNVHRWDEVLRTMKVRVTCSVKIMNSGVTNAEIIDPVSDRNG